MTLIQGRFQVTISPFMSLVLLGCSETAPPAEDTAVTDQSSPDTSYSGPLGTPTRHAFLRIDGGAGEYDWTARAVAAPDGGFYGLGAVNRGRGYRELWVGRFSADGESQWDYVRDRPRVAAEEPRGAVQTDSGLVVLASETDDGGWGWGFEPFWLAELNAEGSLLWERGCEVFPEGSCGSQHLARLADGDLLAAGTPIVKGRPDGEFIVHRFAATGDYLESTTLDGLVFVDGFDANADGKLVLVDLDDDTATVQVRTLTGTVEWAWTVALTGQGWLHGVAIAPDGRVAFAGGSRADDVVTPWGALLTPNGQLQRQLDDLGGISALAFDPAGDLYLAGGQDGVRRTRLDRSGALRWADSRQGITAQDHGEAVQVIAPLGREGFVTAGYGAGEGVANYDLMFEVLAWPQGSVPPADHLPDSAPIDRAIPGAPLRLWTELCPAAANEPPPLTFCDATIQVAPVAGSTSGFEFGPRTGPMPAANLPRVETQSDWLVFREPTTGDLVARWSRPDETPYWRVEQEVGDLLVLRTDHFAILLDSSDPVSPSLIACLPAGSQLPAGRIAANDRWIVVPVDYDAGEDRSEMPPGTLPHTRVFDRQAVEIAESARVIDFEADSNPLLYGDRVFLANGNRARLVDLAPTIPATLASSMQGVGYGHRIVAAGGFAVPSNPHSQAFAFDLGAELARYTAVVRDCGFDLTPVEGGSPASVVEGRPDRLAFGADLECPLPPNAEYATVIPEPMPPGTVYDLSIPSAARLLIRDATSLRIVSPTDPQVDLTPADLETTGVHWLKSSIVFSRAMVGDFGGGSLTFEVRDPAGAGPGRFISTPGPPIAWLDDGEVIWGLGWGNMYPTDDGAGPPPSARLLWRVDPEAGADEAEVLPLGENAAPDRIAVAPGLVFVTHRDSRVWRLDATGALLAETELSVPLGGWWPLAVPGLGLIARDQYGLAVWLSEDLQGARGTTACSSFEPVDSVLTAEGPVLVGYGSTSASPVTQRVIVAVRAVADDAETFHWETLGTLAPSSSVWGPSVIAGPGLWSYDRRLIELLLVPQ